LFKTCEEIYLYNKTDAKKYEILHTQNPCPLNKIVSKKYNKQNPWKATPKTLTPSKKYPSFTIQVTQK